MAQIDPVYASCQDVTWTTSDPLVATVDCNGIVTSLNGGTAVIRATTTDGKFYDEAVVNVAVPVTGVSLNYDDYTLLLTEILNLQAVISPSDATIRH